MSNESPLRLASRLAQAGRTAEAIACLEAALAASRSDRERPANASLLARTAGLLSQQAGHLASAAFYYEEALALDRDPLLLLALAGVRWQFGQAEAAQISLAEAESLAKASSDDDALSMIASLRTRWSGR